MHNLQRIIDEWAPYEFEIVVIDVLENPQIAEEEKILATPTLIKESPSPLKRIIGDLSDTAKVLRGLDIARASNKEANS
jgi:circadian clock protein KaiB